MFNIVLLSPEMPANTGNIGRTCVITNSNLHLIKPYGFILNDRYIKRAGLDYWDRLSLTQHIDTDAFFRCYANETQTAEESSGSAAGQNDADKENQPHLYFATTKAKKRYTDVSFKPGDYIMFGPESAGIPEEILADNFESCIRIPMLAGERSLNLSNSVAIILYEALRQNEFEGLEEEGELHRLSWKI